MTARQSGEFYSLTTYDGQVLTMPDEVVSLPEIGGWAMPPVNWITKQGYRQHGETELGYILQKRPLTLKFHWVSAQTHYQYWQNRAALIDFLRHNRSGPLTLTVALPGDNITDPSTYSLSGQTVASNQAAGDITLTVSSAFFFAVGMYIRINQEYMKITSINLVTNVLGVQRGANGTAATAHSSGTTVYYSPGSQVTRLRSIVIRADPGFIADVDSSREAGWFIDESIKFVAFNPIWFDPVPEVVGQNIIVATSLIFPITFPITFSAAAGVFQTNIAYAGSWYAYPTITLTGPYNSATITNLTTGVTFFMSVPLAVGQQRIITTTPGAISILDQNGVNCFGELGPTSNLTDFNLRPAPEAPGGVNNIYIALNGASGNAAVSLSYNTNFIGI